MLILLLLIAYCLLLFDLMCQSIVEALVLVALVIRVFGVAIDEAHLLPHRCL
jgi:hypothetical protein